MIQFAHCLTELIIVNKLLRLKFKLGVPAESQHRWRMELEGKAKVIASVWGAEIIQFLATLAVLPWKKRLNSSYLSTSTKAKRLERQGIEQILPPEQMQRPLPCLLILSFFYESESLKVTSSIFFIVMIVNMINLTKMIHFAQCLTELQKRPPWGGENKRFC